MDNVNKKQEHRKCTYSIQLNEALRKEILNRAKERGLSFSMTVVTMIIDSITKERVRLRDDDAYDENIHELWK